MTSPKGFGLIVPFPETDACGGDSCRLVSSPIATRIDDHHATAFTVNDTRTTVRRRLLRNDIDMKEQLGFMELRRRLLLHTDDSRTFRSTFATAEYFQMSIIILLAEAHRYQCGQQRCPIGADVVPCLLPALDAAGESGGGQGSKAVARTTSPQAIRSKHKTVLDVVNAVREEFKKEEENVGIAYQSAMLLIQRARVFASISRM